MIRQSIKIQLMTIMGKKTYMFVVLLIFGLIFTNFLINVFTFRGTDVVDMYDPMKLLLFKNFGSYSHFEILNQIIYYFPLVHFIYVFAGIVTIAILSAIPSLAYLLKHKNDVLYDIF